MLNKRFDAFFPNKAVANMFVAILAIMERHFGIVEMAHDQTLKTNDLIKALYRFVHRLGVAQIVTACKRVLCVKASPNVTAALGALPHCLPFLKQITHP